MQAACRLHAALHAACNLLHAGCCNLQPPAYDRMQAAWSHEACMQAATSCMQPAASCNLLHTIVFTKSATIGTTFRRPRSAGHRRRRAGRRRPALRRRRPSKIRSRESRDRINISNHILIEIRSKLSWMTLKTSLSLGRSVALPQS